jgi:hypothetical protein
MGRRTIGRTETVRHGKCKSLSNKTHVNKSCLIKAAFILLTYLQLNWFK